LKVFHVVAVTMARV